MTVCFTEITFLSTNATLVCDLSDIEICCNSLYLSFYLSGYRYLRESLHDGRSIIRTESLPFWWRYIYESPKCEAKPRGGRFWASKSHLTADISKTGKSERYTNYMSISAEHQLNESFLKM